MPTEATEGGGVAEGDRAGRRVLVLGRRRRLEDRLRARGVPYALWVERPLERLPRGVHCEVAPFPRTRKPVEAILERFVDHGPFTHCIAAIEASVVTASLARRVLGARRSAHSVARRCHDKLLMKKRLRDAGVPVTDFVDLGRDDELPRANELGRPLVVKERASSGSRGMELITDEEVDPNALRSRGRIAERFVAGIEASVESFVHEGRVVWSSTTNYWRPKHVNVVPSGFARERVARMLEVNRQAIEALTIRWGMTHLELFLTDEGCVVGEVALRPPGGYLMRCLELAYGFDPWEAFCAVELGEAPTLPPNTPPTPTAVVVLHPGDGLVTRIRGVEEVRAHPAHVDTLLKVRPGDRIAPREGVGDDIGRVLLRAPTHAALDEAIRFVEERLVVEREA